MRDGWTTATLGDVSDVLGGATPKTKEPSYWDGGDILWITPSEITRQDGEVIIDTDRKITPLGLEKSSAKLLPAGTVLVTSRATVGAVAIAGSPITTNQGFAALVPHQEVVSPRFLMYWVQANRDEFRSRASGSTFPEVSRKIVKTIPIRLPPLAVQRRIVDLIDHIDAALLRAKSQLQQTSQVLRVLAEAAVAEALPDWAEPLSEALSDGLYVDGDWVESKDQDPDGDVRLLQLADIGVGVFLDKSNRWMRSDQSERLNCTYLLSDDVLISRMADPIGRAALLPEHLAGSVTAVDVAIARPGETMDPRWLMYVCNTGYFHRQCQSMQRGTTRTRISRKNMGTIEVPVPPLDRQMDACERLDAVAQVARRAAGTSEALEQLRAEVLSSLLSGDHEIPESYNRFLEGQGAA